MTLRKRVVSALIYPAVLVTLSVTMVFIMLTKVIPRFAEFYAGFNADLPIFTKLLITVATTLNDHFIMTLAGAVIIFLLLRRWIRRQCSLPGPPRGAEPRGS